MHTPCSHHQNTMITNDGVVCLCSVNIVLVSTSILVSIINSLGDGKSVTGLQLALFCMNQLRDVVNMGIFIYVATRFRSGKPALVPGRVSLGKRRVVTGKTRRRP